MPLRERETGWLCCVAGWIHFSSGLVEWDRRREGCCGHEGVGGGSGVILTDHWRGDADRELNPIWIG